MTPLLNSPKNMPKNSRHHTSYDSLMRYAERLGYGDVHAKIDKKTGLKAIIAINNLKLGPAIGGARFASYQTMDQAYEDALRLGHMMSYKAAINNLLQGGAKSVIIKPKIIPNYEAFFEQFGEFVNELDGRYITAIDIGTSPREMDIIARRTPYVTCTTASGAGSDPSPFTAYGIRRAIQAAVQFKLGKASLAGIQVGIQGAGHVGFYLAKELKALGAEITMADINQAALTRCVDEIGVNICESTDIYRLPLDVFSPCARGGILNLNIINQLNTSIVAGSANNQLAHAHYASLLHDRNILYAPDFLINAGGLIHVSMMYHHGDPQKALDQIHHLYDTTYAIFETSQQKNCSPNEVAISIARDRLTR